MTVGMLRVGGAREDDKQRRTTMGPARSDRLKLNGAGKGIMVVARKTLDVVGTIEPSGILGPGHHIATDSKGNIYLAQTTRGLQKLAFKGMSPPLGR